MSIIHFKKENEILNENSPILYENKPIFNEGINLYPYQSVIVQKMYENEVVTSFNVSETDLIPHKNINVIRKAVRLAAKLGTGKTFMILALIKITRPSWRKNIENDPSFHTDNTPFKITEPIIYYSKQETNKFMTMVEKTLPRIRTNIVMCQKTIIGQWEKTTTENTDHTFLTVYDSKSLQTFIDILFSCNENKNMKPIEKFDFILVNINTVSIKNIRFYNMKSEALEKQQSNIPFVMSVILQNYCFDRIFIDDFDMQYQAGPSSLTDYTNIHAKFYYYVSSTDNSNKNQSLVYKQRYSDVFSKPYEMNLVNIGSNINVGVTSNVYLNATKILCDDNFVINTIQIPSVVERIHVVENPEKKILQGIEALGLENSAEIKRLFHEGAHSEISSMLKTNCNSASDIFKKVLGDRYNEFVRAKYYKSFLETLQRLRYGPFGTFHKLFNAFMKMPNIKPEDIEPFILKNFQLDFHHHDLSLHIEETNIKISKLSGIIDRAKASLLEADVCGICAADVKEDNLVIGLLRKCCNYACCMDCINNAIKKSTSLGSLCPNCRKPFNIADVIQIGSSFVDNFTNLDEIISKDLNTLDEKVVEVEKDEHYRMKKEDVMMFYAVRTLKNMTHTPFEYKKLKNHTDDDSDDYAERISKYLQQFENKGAKESIAEFQDLPQGTVIKSNIKGLMQSSGIEGVIPKDGEYKLIIFASHDETLERAEKNLYKYGIPFLRVQGTYKQIGTQVKMFDSHKVNILTVNNTKYSSGLHLISANHVIMLHSINSDAEKSQLCGRIVRIGQKWRPNIVTIKFDTE